MSMQDRLNQDMKEAMKAREEGKLCLSVIRMVKAAIKNVEIDSKKELSDEEVIEVLAREAKKRRDSMEEYRKAGREDIVQGLEQEIEVLIQYLPAQLTEDEIRELVKQAITETGAKEAKEIGKVMGWLKPKIKGRADGKLVNAIVKENLS